MRIVREFKFGNKVTLKTWRKDKRGIFVRYRIHKFSKKKKKVAKVLITDGRILTFELRQLKKGWIKHS